MSFILVNFSISDWNILKCGVFFFSKKKGGGAFIDNHCCKRTTQCVAWTWEEWGILKAELCSMHGFWWVLDQKPLQSDIMDKCKCLRILLHHLDEPHETTGKYQTTLTIHSTVSGLCSPLMDSQKSPTSFRTKGISYQNLLALHTDSVLIP